MAISFRALQSVQVFIALALSMPLRADSHVVRFSIDDILAKHGETLELPPIVSGCELVDCCPGCTRDNLIEWRIRLGQGPIAALSLTFDNLSASERDGLRLENSQDGEIKHNRVYITGRQALLKAFSPGLSGRAPVAHPTIKWNREALREWGRSMTDAVQPAASVEPIDVGRLEISIEQLMGDVVVSEYTCTLVGRIRQPRMLSRAPRPKASDTGGRPLNAPCDSIAVEGNGGQEVAVFVSGRHASGPVSYEPYRIVDSSCVDNFLAPLQGERSEIDAFAVGHAMVLRENVDWTDHPWDPEVIRLDSPLSIDVLVWLLVPNTTAFAQGHVAYANDLYDVNCAGLSFNASIKDVSDDEEARRIVGTDPVPMCTEEWVRGLKESPYFKRGYVNVYYVGIAYYSMTCEAERNIIVIDSLFQDDSLAHELGHACSLDHPLGSSGLYSNNIMYAGGTGRTTCSKGQGFRMNADPRSVVISSGLRRRPTTGVLPPLTLN